MADCWSINELDASFPRPSPSPASPRSSQPTSQSSLGPTTYPQPRTLVGSHIVTSSSGAEANRKKKKTSSSLPLSSRRRLPRQTKPYTDSLGSMISFPPPRHCLRTRHRSSLISRRVLHGSTTHGDTAAPFHANALLRDQHRDSKHRSLVTGPEEDARAARNERLSSHPLPRLLLPAILKRPALSSSLRIHPVRL